jgi:hypothetical protein
MTSNTVVNLNKVRAANKNKFVGAQVLVFDYFAPESANGDVEQRPIVRVVQNSLRRTKEGEWVFAGVNLYRVDDNDSGVRTYRLSRMNGIARKP